LRTRTRTSNRSDRDRRAFGTRRSSARRASCRSRIRWSGRRRSRRTAPCTFARRRRTIDVGPRRGRSRRSCAGRSTHCRGSRASPARRS
jgi:hypothetical protein